MRPIKNAHLIVAAVYDRRYICETLKMATLIERRYSHFVDVRL
jgi:hypothetical protein